MTTPAAAFSISHRTTLRYSEEITISYNEVRMRPRDRGTQRTLNFALMTRPQAVPRSRVDYFGNVVHRVDVTEPHEELTIEVEAVVEHGAVKPRRLGRWHPEQLDLDPRLEYALSSPRVPLAPRTAALLQEWVGDDRSWDSLLAIAARTQQEFEYLAGATDVDSSIDDLLDGGAGVCQDFTHLFLALARHAGWPARYVSGYLGPRGEDEQVVGASHAWAEVCGAGGQWVGIDPTHGGLTGLHHLRLAVGRDYGDVAPHRGLFFGSGAGLPPEVEVRIARMTPQQVGVIHRGNAVAWQQQQQQQ